MMGVLAYLEHLMEFKPRSIIFEDLEIAWPKVHTEHVELVLTEEEIFAVWSEIDGEMATDLIEHRLGASEEGQEEDEVHHFEIDLKFIITC